MAKVWLKDTLSISKTQIIWFWRWFSAGVHVLRVGVLTDHSYARFMAVKKKTTFEIRLGMGWNTPNNTFPLVRTLFCKRFFSPSSARPIHKVQPTHYEKKLWIWGCTFWLKSKRKRKKKKVRHTMWTKPNKIYVWAVGLCLFHGSAAWNWWTKTLESL